MPKDGAINKNKIYTIDVGLEVIDLHILQNATTLYNCIIRFKLFYAFLT